MKKRTYWCGIRVPEGLNLNSVQGLRWTRLVSFYADRLGEQRIRNDEVIRALLVSPIAITLRSEQVAQDVALGKPADDLLRLSTQMNLLLVKLGLTPSSSHNKREPQKPQEEKPSEEMQPFPASRPPAANLAEFLAARKAGAAE